jgi:anti-sigma-K factor RskA
VAVLAAPDLARIDLAGQPAAPSASARAFWSRSRGLVFTASNLPAPPPGRAYQLWVLTAQPAPISAGMLTPDGNGHVNARFDMSVDLPRPVAMAVTLEPEGGVPAPTGDKYLVGLAN